MTATAEKNTDSLPQGNEPVRTRAYLQYLIERGHVERFGYPLAFESEHQERVDREFGVIAKAGFCSYFLILTDIMEFCRRENIPYGPGRGSVGGSMVGYLTGAKYLTWSVKYAILGAGILSSYLKELSMGQVKADREDPNKISATEITALEALRTDPDIATGKDLAEALNYAEEHLAPHEQRTKPYTSRGAGMIFGLLRDRGLVEFTGNRNKNKHTWALTSSGRTFRPSVSS